MPDRRSGVPRAQKAMSERCPASFSDPKWSDRRTPPGPRASRGGVGHLLHPSRLGQPGLGAYLDTEGARYYLGFGTEFVDQIWAPDRGRIAEEPAPRLWPSATGSGQPPSSTAGDERRSCARNLCHAVEDVDALGFPEMQQVDEDPVFGQFVALAPIDVDHAHFAWRS